MHSCKNRQRVSTRVAQDGLEIKYGYLRVFVAESMSFTLKKIQDSTRRVEKSEVKNYEVFININVVEARRVRSIVVEIGTLFRRA